MSIDTEIKKIFPQNQIVQGDEMVNGVSVDIARHFGVDVMKVSDEQKKRLNDIHSWSKDLGNKTKEELLSNMRNIRQRTGRPQLGEDELTNTWNWLRIRKYNKDRHAR